MREIPKKLVRITSFLTVGSEMKLSKIGRNID